MQSSIEKLNNELEQQTEAIRACGTDIVKIRKEKQEAEAERDAMKRR